MKIKILIISLFITAVQAMNKGGAAAQQQAPVDLAQEQNPLDKINVLDNQRIVAGYLDKWENITITEKQGGNRITIEGDKIIVNSFDNKIRIWDSNNNQLLDTFEGHHDSVTGIVIAENKIVSISVDNTIKIWDFNNGKLHTFKDHYALNVMAISENKIVSGSNFNIIQIWDLNKAKRLKILKAHDIPNVNNRDNWVYALAIAGDKIVAGYTDSKIRIWNINNGKLLKILEGHEGQINTIAISGDKIVSGSGDRTIKIWDLNTGELLNTLQGHTNFVRSIEIYREKIISGSADGTIRIWDINNGNLITLIEGYNNYNSIAIDGDKIIFAFCGGKIGICDINTGELLDILDGHNVNVIAIAKVKNKIVSASCDGTIKIWQNKGQELLKRIANSVQKLNEKKEKLCANCSKAADKRCTRCKTLYCSKECQRAHWPTHKLKCEARRSPLVKTGKKHKKNCKKSRI